MLWLKATTRLIPYSLLKPHSTNRPKPAANATWEPSCKQNSSSRMDHSLFKSYLSWTCQKMTSDRVKRSCSTCVWLLIKVKHTRSRLTMKNSLSSKMALSHLCSSSNTPKTSRKTGLNLLKCLVKCSIKTSKWLRALSKLRLSPPLPNLLIRTSKRLRKLGWR